MLSIRRIGSRLSTWGSGQPHTHSQRSSRLSHLDHSRSLSGTPCWLRCVVAISGVHTQVFLAFLLNGGEDFYLCVDVADFLLSRSTEEKTALRTFLSLDAFLLAQLMWIKKTVSPARPHTSQWCNWVHSWAFPTWASTPMGALLPNIPCNHGLCFVLRKLFIWMYVNRWMLEAKHAAPCLWQACPSLALLLWMASLFSLRPCS